MATEVVLDTIIDGIMAREVVLDTTIEGLEMTMTERIGEVLGLQKKTTRYHPGQVMMMITPPIQMTIVVTMEI